MPFSAIEGFIVEGPAGFAGVEIARSGWTGLIVNPRYLVLSGPEADSLQWNTGYSITESSFLSVDWLIWEGSDLVCSKRAFLNPHSGKWSVRKIPKGVIYDRSPANSQTPEPGTGVMILLAAGGISLAKIRPHR
jgi:hypothetical protein